MRKKIEIINDEMVETEAAPEFADHINPPNASETKGSSSASVSGTPGEVPIAEAAPDPNPTITLLRTELEAARREIEEAEKRLLYAQSEFQNYRRRKEESEKELLKFAKGELITALLPTVDNFERALKAAEQTRSFDALIGGVQGTLKQLQTFLQQAGVKPIEALGKEFDPNYHEAIGHTEESGYPANTVAEEVQRGYEMHERVLRPTLVKVSQG